MTTVQNIALAKLSVSSLNARALSPAEVEGLAASIASLGLLQPLSVYAEGDGFKVEDGARRFAALHLFDAVKDKWAGRLPNTLEAAIPVVGALKAKEKAELAALCLGRSLDATEAGLHSYQRNPSRWASLGVITRAIGHKIADHWTPGADWLTKGAKPALLAGLKACGVSRFTADHKKADMAAALAREAKANGWVPKLLADLTPGDEGDAQVEDDAARMAAE